MAFIMKNLNAFLIKHYTNLIALLIRMKNFKFVLFDAPVNCKVNTFNQRM